MNRAFTQEGILVANTAAGRESSNGSHAVGSSTHGTSQIEHHIHSAYPPGSHATNGCRARLGVEAVRAAEVAAVICGATMFVDIHSTSAAAAPFAFHAPSKAAQEWAATFAVGFTVEDTSLIGTTFEWAARQVRHKLRNALVRPGEVMPSSFGQHRTLSHL